MTDFTKLTKDEWARVRTRDGQRVEVLTVNGRGNCPIVAYVGNSTAIQLYGPDGRYWWESKVQSDDDLILPPEPMVRYIVTFDDGSPVSMSGSVNKLHGAFRQFRVTLGDNPTICEVKA